MTRLIFVPGLLCTEQLFYPQIKALSATCNITIAETKGMDSIAQMARQLIDEIEHDEDGDKPILVGLSMGGYVVLEALHLAQEKFSGFALLSTSCRADDAQRKQQRKELIALSEIGRFKGVTPRLLPRFLSPEALKDQHLVQTVMDMAAEIGQKNFTLQQTAIMARQDHLDTLSSFNLPALVCCGQLDVLTPPALSIEMAERLSDAELVLLDNVGHLSTLEAAEAVTTALSRLIKRISPSQDVLV